MPSRAVTPGRSPPTGRAAFPYLAGPVPIEGPFAFGFQATPAAGADFTTLVAGPSGSAYLGINTLSDGRQEMVNAVTGNASQTHHQLLRHGIINWLTRGVFLGHQRDYFAMQVDDVFLPDDRWDMARNLTGVDGPTTATDEYQCDRHVIDDHQRLPAADPDDRRRRDPRDQLAEHQRAQARHGLQRSGQRGGHRCRRGAPDPLTDAFLANKSQFHWINHTWSHLQLDTLSQDSDPERDRPEHPVGPAPRGAAVRSDGAGDRRALRAAQSRDAGRDQPDRHPLDRGRQLARADALRDRPGDDGAPLPLERLLQRRRPWRSSSTSTTTSTCRRRSAASA